jgi:GTP-binding protein
MEIRRARFAFSSSKISQIPRDGKSEIAFIGRSNVGKSSLINMLLGQRLALVSGTPGKTRLVNHFLVNDTWYLVDLPGYGYARRAKSEREQFGSLIMSYVLGAEKMQLLFVLIDSRHEPLKIDLDFINLLGEKGVPFALVFTKSDKQSFATTTTNIENYKTTLKETWDELPPMFITSSVKSHGREELLDYIGKIV